MTNTDIANQSLSRLGQSLVSDLSENSPSAIVCRTHYEAVRDSLLRQHPWNFAVARAQLTESDTAPAFGWDHQYALPADCLRILTLNGIQAAMCASDFETESGYLLTDAVEAKITYVRRVVDPTLFDPIFVEVFVHRLGGAIAVALTGSEQKRNELEALASEKMREATFADAGERRATVKSPVINRLAGAPGDGFSRDTTYLLPVDGGATVDNASVNAAIETDATATRTSLGLGNSATRNVGTTAGTVCAGDDIRLGAPPSSIGNDVVNSAIGENPSATRAALELGDAATKSTGTTAGTVAAGNDSRLSDSRTPTSHKSSHATGGSDALTAADIGAVATSYLAEQTLTDAATITYDAASGVNAKVTLGGDRTLSVPTNVTVGHSGTLQIIQDGTGGRALTLASGWGLTTGNLASVAAMTASKKALLSWRCTASGEFISTLIFRP